MLYRNADGSLLRNDTGGLATDANCCCDEPCGCCWQAYVTLLRETSLDTWQWAASAPGSGFGCTFADASPESPLQCGDEFFVLETATEPECTCQWIANSDTNSYSTLPCFQQYYTTAAEDQVCDYGPPGGLGLETHKGTMSLRHVISVDMCYEPCGTMEIHITHRIYCEFGVYVRNVPTSPLSPVIEAWFPDSAPIEIAYSEFNWIGVTTPSCPGYSSEATLGPPTSSILAPPFTKTWGRNFTNCGGASSFTKTFPGACEATGLTLIGNGPPCECP